MLFELMGLRYRLMQIWRIESRNHLLTVNMETTTIRSLRFATFEPNTLHGSFSLQHLITFTAILSRGLYGTSAFRMYVDMWPIQSGVSSQTSILSKFPKISPSAVLKHYRMGTAGHRARCTAIKAPDACLFQGRSVP
jgi:hypothetical protein